MTPRTPALRVKLFADGADLASMRTLASDPKIRGFTTNPTLMRASGISAYEPFARELLSLIPDKPISFEVVGDDEATILRQARLLASWAKNVYVKIPVTTTTGASNAKIVKTLAHDGVQLNVTAVFTLAQVQEMCAALQGGAPSVVSVFAGRIADAGIDPVPHMKAARAICRAYDARIELLWASPRELLNVLQADESGADIITATPALLSKLDNLGKDLTQFSLETVQMFKRDADAAGLTL